jgi:hypothetical protein
MLPDIGDTICLEGTLYVETASSSKPPVIGDCGIVKGSGTDNDSVVVDFGHLGVHTVRSTGAEVWRAVDGGEEHDDDADDYTDDDDDYDNGRSSRFIVGHEDAVFAAMAVGIDPRTVPFHVWVQGLRVEMEHVRRKQTSVVSDLVSAAAPAPPQGDDKDAVLVIVGKIAAEHLSEDIHYYQRLAAVERAGRQYWEEHSMIGKGKGGKSKPSVLVDPSVLETEDGQAQWQVWAEANGYKI